MSQLAEKYTDPKERKRYQLAAVKFRLPFWDPFRASKPRRRRQRRSSVRLRVSTDFETTHRFRQVLGRSKADTQSS